MPVPEPPFEPEEIAALIDGRLRGAERARAIEQLARSEAAFEAFAEAVRTAAEEPVAKDVVHLPAVAAARRWWSAFRAPLAAAAALVLVLGASAVWLMTSPAGGPIAAQELVLPLVRTADARLALGEDWHQRDWSVTRGGPSRLVEPSLAFRLGVRAVDLEVALALGDTDRADSFLVEIVAWLGEIEMSQPVASRYQALRTQVGAGASPGELLELAATAEGSMDQFLGSSSFALGKWSGAAALAARQREAAFFQAGPSQRLLDRLLPEQFPGSTAVLLRRIEDLLRDGVDQTEYPELDDLLRQVIQLNAG